VALGDHLCADEEIDFAGVKAGEQMLEIVAAANRISIHAANARAGEDLRETFFSLL
jgi:hypothetical protein